jgi:hypothetical protein
MNAVRPALIRAVLAAALGFPGGLAGAGTGEAPPPAHRVSGQVLPAGVGAIKELRFGKEFRYAGGHRFVLKRIADAEQHFFVVPRKPGTVRRLYWIQFEKLLPGMGESYDYSSDATVTIGGLPFRRNTRRWDVPPEPDSDRAAMYAFLEKQGYRIPDGALRIRFVHVPENDPRQELMIVYAEAPESSEASPPSKIDVQRRALDGLKVVAGPTAAGR